VKKVKLMIGDLEIELSNFEYDIGDPTPMLPERIRVFSFDEAYFHIEFELGHVVDKPRYTSLLLPVLFQGPQ